MKQKSVDLSLFKANGFDKGASAIRRILWYYTNAFFVKPSWNVFMGFKLSLYRLFGAKIGGGMVIKNNVNVKSPWNLVAGNNVWLGEKSWIDNLDKVILGNNVCISQGALLLTGNHDYTKPDFPYLNNQIVIEDGAWIGAKAIVCAGVVVHTHAVLCAGSVATKDLDAFCIYQGNPAIKIRERVIESKTSK